MNKKIIWLFTVVALVIIVFSVFFSYNYMQKLILQTQNNISTQNTGWKTGDEFAGFDKIAVYIKNLGTKIPILLPTELPDTFYQQEETAISQNGLYADVNASADEYDIVINFGSDCHGVSACSVASINAKKYEAITNDGLDKVNLIDGVVGYYKDMTCGASCSPQSIEWIYNNAHYTIQMALEREDIINLANSAIQNITK